VEEEEPLSFDDDEEIGEKPSTAKANFDPTTLWKLKELKDRLRVKREESGPDFELSTEELEVPKVEKSKASKLGEVKISFNQPMLFDDVFAGLTFSSDTSNDTDSSDKPKR